jgi:hypothetical protein
MQDCFYVLSVSFETAFLTLLEAKKMLRNAVELNVLDLDADLIP